MKYFISHIPACRLYAKCPGWQETLAHFFVKARRSSLTQLLPHRRSSTNVLSKEQSFDSSQGSANFMNTTDNQRKVSTSSPIFDLVMTPDDSLSYKQIDKIDPSMIESQTDFDLTQTFGFSEQSLASNPIVISIDNKHITDDFQGYSNDIIITPPHSLTDSGEDLLSPFKTDYLSINPLGMARDRSDLSTLQRSIMTTSMTTSMTLSYDGRDIYEDHRRLISSLREYLGWRIALVINALN
jgi:hypothetical protein